MNDRPELRKGYTTGACAAAAGKGAVLMLLTGRRAREVSIRLPGGGSARFQLVDEHVGSCTARCGVIKDAGDDPDVTHGATIMAGAEWSNGGVSILGGAGVGVVTKPGLQVPVGGAAINPVPGRMMREAVRELTGRGVEITISVPGGEDLAKKTFNPRLGILRGISIIGTTGIVEPKSTEAFKASLLCALDVAKAQGISSLVMVPGKIGEKGIRRYLPLQDDQVVQVGNYVGFMLEAALQRGFPRVLLAGHPGKLLKLIRGDFETHSSHSISAALVVVEALRQHHNALLDEELYKNLDTVEGFIQWLPRGTSEELFGRLAEEVQLAVEDYVNRRMELGVVLLSMDGIVIGESSGARPWRVNR